MQHLYDRFKDRGFTILAISIDVQGAKVVEPYVKERNLTFPHLLDSKSEVARTYGIRGTPTNFFVNKAGMVVSGASGLKDWDREEAIKYIVQLLGEPGT